MNRYKKELLTNKREFILILFHFLLGVVGSSFKSGIKMYAALVLFYSFYHIIKKNNANNIALLLCAYYVGADVFFRMTGGLFFYEQVKYAVILLLLLGEFYRPGRQNTLAFWIYLLLLVPGIFVALNALDADTNARKAIAFNLSGPVALGIAAIHCYGRKVTYKQIGEILFYMALPVLSMTVYLFLFTPDLESVITGTHSNFETSGGFGPNQVATALGIGIFVFFVRFTLYSPNLVWRLINGFLLAVIVFRALLTFSRGGVLTSVAMIAVFLGVTYLSSKGKLKLKLVKVVSLLAVILVSTWLYSNIVSAGMLEKRYRNQDAIGREKVDVTTGRTALIAVEFQAFNENPFFGIGAGRNKGYRYEKTGIMAASHNEVSRIMAEHGSLGILAISILFLVPMGRFLGTHRNIFMLSFFVFWFLTINHSSMRNAAPAFIYALSILTIVNDKSPVHRKQVGASR